MKKKKSKWKENKSIGIYDVSLLRDYDIYLSKEGTFSGPMKNRSSLEECRWLLFMR